MIFTSCQQNSKLTYSRSSPCGGTQQLTVESGREAEPRRRVGHQLQPPPDEQETGEGRVARGRGA